MNCHWGLFLMALCCYAITIGAFLSMWHWMKRSLRDRDPQ